MISESQWLQMNDERITKDRELWMDWMAEMPKHKIVHQTKGHSLDFDIWLQKQIIKICKCVYECLMGSFSHFKCYSICSYICIYLSIFCIFQRLLLFYVRCRCHLKIFEDIRRRNNISCAVSQLENLFYMLREGVV